MARAALPSLEVPAIRVSPCPSERPLRVLVVLAALGIWIALAVSLIGAAYVALFGLVFFFAHVGFITHVRGNGVRLGPEQMPELYRRVNELSARFGLQREPEAYVIQAGGILNALATRFLGSSFIVLYSDLLDACGDDEGARDFIIAHELGHLAAGHLRWRWLLLPGLAVPFLGTAYSRACEYTSDRYGMSVARERAPALNGLCILAAGGKHGPQVNQRALVAQRRDLATAWMKIGQWLGTHPPIARRLAVLEPGLVDVPVRERRAVVGALAILALLVFVPTATTFGVAKRVWPSLQRAMKQAQSQRTQPVAPQAAGAPPAVGPGPVASPAHQEQVRRDILSLAAIVSDMRAQQGAPPADTDELYQAWRAANPGAPDPVDPFDGQAYGYQVDGVEFVIWSAGPNPNDGADDLYYNSAAQAR